MYTAKKADMWRDCRQFLKYTTYVHFHIVYISVMQFSEAVPLYSKGNRIVCICTAVALRIEGMCNDLQSLKDESGVWNFRSGDVA